MNFENLLRDLFGRPQPIPRPAPGPPLRPPAAASTSRSQPSQEQRLMAQKLVGQLRTIDRTYELNLIGDQNKAADWINDLAVKLAYDDLDGVSAEFLDATGNVFYAHRIKVARHVGRAELHSDGGLALPILDKRRLGKARLLVHSKGRNQADYCAQLRIQWAPAERAKFEAGAAFKDAHANKTTGGRGEATIHVGDSLRVPLTITRSGGKGFAFATDASGQLSVFCHAQNAPSGFQFAVGSRVTAVLVQLPKGIQAREIRAAA